MATPEKPVPIDPAGSDLERSTREWGRLLFGKAREGRRELSSLNAWTAEVFRWCLADPRLKANVLQFVDVFPSLKAPRDVISHIRAYFSESHLRMPLPLRMGVGLTGVPFTARAVTELSRVLVEHVARQFIIGSSPDEAFSGIQSLEAQGMGFTLDLLGEATLSDGEADLCARRYGEILEAISLSCAKHPAELPLYSHTPRLNLSVKLSSLSARFDPLPSRETRRDVLTRLVPLLERARSLGAFLNVDMESYEFRDLTLAVLRDALETSSLRGYPHVGIVFQAYLRDCEDSLREFLDWRARRDQPCTIRLVKGAYWDHEVARARQENWPVPVLESKQETDTQFERLACLLFRQPPEVRSAIASHNIRSLAHACAAADESGCPPGRVEFQLLFGMADGVKKALLETGRAVRVYVPYGELVPGMAYLVRRLLENTSNESFLLHDFLHDADEETLLRAPAAEPPPPPEAQAAGFQNEPLSDFSRPVPVRGINEALDRVAAGLGRTHSPGLPGRTAKNRGLLIRTNPARPDEEIGRIPKAAPEDIDAAVARARDAYPAWAERPARDRAAVLDRAAGLLSRSRLEIAALEIFEVGKNRREADADVAEAIDFLRYYGAQTARLESGEALPGAPGEKNRLFYRPRGIGVVISPWNFPAALLTGMASAALAAGNAVIVKPSQLSTFTALAVIERLWEAGVPPDVLQFLPGEGSLIGEALVAHPGTAFVAFTGSREVGLRLIARAAEAAPGQRLVKRVIAEMGGKNAIIVDEDADLDEAVKGILQSAFGYGGQKCSACSRVIALEGVYDGLARRLVEAARSLVIAPPEDPACMMGPLIDGSAVERVESYIRLGKDEARLLHEGSISAACGRGHFAPPVIFGDVDPKSRLAQEEIFGPVLSLVRARGFEEALRLANDCDYALTGGLYSRHPDRIARAAGEFDVGNLYINRKITGARVGRQPFGGHRLSGVGSKAGGPYTLLEYLIPRVVSENTLRHGFPLKE